MYAQLHASESIQSDYNIRQVALFAVVDVSGINAAQVGLVLTFTSVSSALTYQESNLTPY